MRVQAPWPAFLGALLLFCAVPALAGPTGPVDEILDPITDPLLPPGADQVDPTAAVDEVSHLLYALPEGEQNEPAPPGAGRPGLGDRLREAFGERMWLAALMGGLLGAAGIGGFALVTRYISPKEALKNPQRAMLYGFVRATPGVHLKQLSEEFRMKTSSILWHVRKLEAADLVRSERANGFRVFYPVEGGIEIKRLSRAITALQNANARAIHEFVERRPGVPVKEASQRLGVHAGTVRWHLRKLREFGCVEELVRDDGSLFYPTPLGKKALEAVMGSAPTAARNANAPVAPAVAQ